MATLHSSGDSISLYRHTYRIRPVLRLSTTCNEDDPWRWDHYVVSKTLGKEHPLTDRSTPEKRSCRYIRHGECWRFLYLQVIGSPLCYVVMVTDDIQQRLCFHKAVPSDALWLGPLAGTKIRARTFIYKERHSLFFLTWCQLTSRKVTLMRCVSWSITTNVRE